MTGYIVRRVDDDERPFVLQKFEDMDNLPSLDQPEPWAERFSTLEQAVLRYMSYSQGNQQPLPWQGLHIRIASPPSKDGSDIAKKVLDSGVDAVGWEFVRRMRAPTFEGPHEVVRWFRGVYSAGLWQGKLAVDPDRRNLEADNAALRRRLQRQRWPVTVRDQLEGPLPEELRVEFDDEFDDEETS
jgi:hypothetical protein